MNSSLGRRAGMLRMGDAGSARRRTGRGYAEKVPHGTRRERRMASGYAKRVPHGTRRRSAYLATQRRCPTAR